MSGPNVWPRRRHRWAMPLWLIPTLYAGAAFVCGGLFPRLESVYLPSHTLSLSVASAQAYLSAAASGMMVLTGIVFSIAFVMVQFSAIAYSPRLVLWFSRDRTLFHSLGVFVATFIYSLAALAWVDRARSGSVPFISGLVVGTLLVLSMMLFALLVQRLSDLRINNVLQLVGDQGRKVIREMFARVDERTPAEARLQKQAAAGQGRLGPPVQTMVYSGQPRIIAELDVESLVRQAQQREAVIVMACTVGDTLVHGDVLLRVHGVKGACSEQALLRAIELASERTFEQDPKYPIRILVDIAIKALSPAINDPTTAVQAIHQIEDLLRRLASRDLDVGFMCDCSDSLRLVVPVPTWDDYLALAFDEIRQFGLNSVQVMRRLRAALTGLIEAMTVPARIDSVRRYLDHLDRMIERSTLDSEDKIVASQEDRQGLGMPRRQKATQAADYVTGAA